MATILLAALLCCIFHGSIVPAVRASPESGESAASVARPDAADEARPAAADSPPDAEDVEDEGTAALPSEEREAVQAAVARPVPADPIQVFGWREMITIGEIDEAFHAKLDTGALTSSIHAEDIELFERDGDKWVRFIATNPRDEDSSRSVVEAPFIRYARIKEVGGGYSRREVVRLGLKIGDRSLRGEFTLANRSNMLVPVLIGRTMLRDLGWVDSSRTYIADQNIFR